MRKAARLDQRPRALRLHTESTLAEHQPRRITVTETAVRVQDRRRGERAGGSARAAAAHALDRRSAGRLDLRRTSLHENWSLLAGSTTGGRRRRRSTACPFTATVDGLGDPLRPCSRRRSQPLPLIISRLARLVRRDGGVIGPLADPAAHGDPADAFDVVVPSASYSFS
jgi:hypothetical protein